jgi:hypothetical protein
MPTEAPSASVVDGIPLRTYAAAGRSRPGAAVLFYHGLRASAEANDREARALAAAGLTAILPDAPHHGARHSEVLAAMPDALTLEGHRVLLRILREARAEVPRLVDHALAVGHSRVAIAGVSMGGFIALAGATVEPRLAAIVSILGSPDWTPRGGIVPPDLEEAVAESPHLRLGTFPPRPLLLLNGGRDENVPPAPARALAAALAPLYAGAGAGPLVHHEYPDASHFVDEEVWADLWSRAEAFLVEALR